jgi:hypothetical protein
MGDVIQLRFPRAGKNPYADKWFDVLDRRATEKWYLCLILLYIPGKVVRDLDGHTWCYTELFKKVYNLHPINIWEKF